MNYATKQRIALAVRQRNGAALAEAVKQLPSYDRNYDVVADTIHAAGGARLIRPTEIRLGDTTIRNRAGRAEVVERTW